MTRKLGAAAGAFFGVYGVQSALESRTSSLMTALEPGVAGVCVCAAACSEEGFAHPLIHTPAIAKDISTRSDFRSRTTALSTSAFVALIAALNFMRPPLTVGSDRLAKSVPTMPGG